MLQVIRNSADYLNEHPSVGVLSGFGSGVMLSVQNFFMDEHYLHFVAAMGVWLGTMVAGLTLFLKLCDLAIRCVNYARNYRKDK
jgi:hypothetical protein